MKIEIKSENVTGDVGVLVGEFRDSIKIDFRACNPCFQISAVGCKTCSVPYLAKISYRFPSKNWGGGGGAISGRNTCNYPLAQVSAAGKVRSGEGERFGVMRRLWSLLGWVGYLGLFADA